jgi:hypothetical protein
MEGFCADSQVVKYLDDGERLWSSDKYFFNKAHQFCEDAGISEAP